MIDSQVSHALVVSLTKGIIDLTQVFPLDRREFFSHYFLFYIKG
jgi:hypothetical protein